MTTIEYHLLLIYQWLDCWG